MTTVPEHCSVPLRHGPRNPDTVQPMAKARLSFQCRMPENDGSNQWKRKWHRVPVKPAKLSQMPMGSRMKVRLCWNSRSVGAA